MRRVIFHFKYLKKVPQPASCENGPQAACQAQKYEVNEALLCPHWCGVYTPVAWGRETKVSLLKGFAIEFSRAIVQGLHRLPVNYEILDHLQWR